MEIYIDGQLYKSYDVNFDNGTKVETTDLQGLGESLSKEEHADEERDDGYQQPQEDDDE